MLKYLIYIFIFLFLANCSNKTIYSGKILNKNDFKDINFTNKEKLINTLGNPSYIDPIEKKYFYFSEKSEKRSVFKKQIEYSYVFVFELDGNENIVNSSVYNIKDLKNIELSNEKTTNEIVDRGLLEKIFGGVGTQQEIPTSPWYLFKVKLQLTTTMLLY